jgi:tetratricopeptide (TPR) repeat protein
VRSRRHLAVFCLLFFCVGAAVAASQQPSELADLIASARKAQTERNFEAAAEYYRKAVALQPDIAELRTNLGLMYYQTGKDQQAIDSLLQAIRLKPDLFVPNLFLGLEYVKQKRFGDALPYLVRASQANSADVQLQLALARAYTGTGRADLAIRSYIRATELEPGNAAAWFHLGLAYLQQVEIDARILVNKDRQSTYVQVLMADSFAERRAFRQAATSYEKALNLPAVPPGTRARYAFALLSQHDYSRAERELNAEFVSHPASPWAKLGVARLQLERGPGKDSATRIAEIWKADPGFLQSNIQLFRAGLPPDKVSQLRMFLEELRALGEIPEEAISLFHLGAVDEKPGGPIASQSDTTAKRVFTSKETQMDAAEFYDRGEYRKCSDLLAPHIATFTAKSLRLLAVCAYSTGDYRNAFDAATKLAASPESELEGLYWQTKASQKLGAEALSHASQIDHGSSKLHTLLGDIYRQQNRLREAELEYREALSVQPHDPGALFGLSLALLADGQIDEAFHVAHGAWAENPDDPELNAVMGEILCQRDRFTEAETYLTKSLNTKPEYVSHVHALLGKVYANTDRPQDAIAEFKLALPEDKDGHLYYQMGRLYMKIGDRHSAEQAFAVSKRLEREGLNNTDDHLRPDQYDTEFE